MPFLRHDVSTLSAEVWSPTLEWYAKGVRALQKRQFGDPTSWWFLAAMHGIDRPTWDAFGYAKGQPAPTPALTKKFLRKCQHQSWYFLPWHRGYLAAFEAIVRAAVVAEGGPADWALPYWDYNNPRVSTANRMPAAFAAHKMPDNSDNPLFIRERYGDGEGHFVLDRDRDIRLDALGDSEFPGGENAIPPGFGGPATVFHHGNEQDDAPNGHLESIPHNNVHTAVGGLRPGADRRRPRTVDLGLMTDPDLAALDPIFWLHHANIDRLWASWRQAPSHADPDDDAWLSGPVGDTFFMPTPDGGELQFAAKDMLDTTAPNLDYSYENLTPLPPSRRDQRVSRLGLPESATQSIQAEGLSVAVKKPAELIGSSEASVDLSGGKLSADVKLDPRSRDSVAQSHEMSAQESLTTEPDRVFVKLENVRGDNDAALYYVYVGLDAAADPAAHPQNFAGSLSFFGVSKASATADGGAGNGLTQVIEITDIVDELHLRGALASVNQLGVRFVPRGTANYGGGLSIGRVTIFRQPQ